ncbi:hypothetical protein AAFF_G00182980 [Aldrovandia affinis]|uniref:Uncharacterized protein n=1 Tax=Aldrovandia affinis TaxID=143900 RepID=A0AAD7RK95_9TELE|nr:hypothetical protein AAFF_G00182980 [Aldrovandia affinis]
MLCGPLVLSVCDKVERNRSPSNTLLCLSIGSFQEAIRFTLSVVKVERHIKAVLQGCHFSDVAPRSPTLTLVSRAPCNLDTHHCGKECGRLFTNLAVWQQGAVRPYIALPRCPSAGPINSAFDEEGPVLKTYLFRLHHGS